NQSRHQFAAHTFAQRQGSCPSFQMMLDLKKLRQMLNAFFLFRACDEINFRNQIQALKDRHMHIKLAASAKNQTQLLIGLATSGRKPHNLSKTRGRSQNSAQHFNSRALPRSVRAQESHDFAFVDLEIQVFDRKKALGFMGAARIGLRKLANRDGLHLRMLEDAPRGDKKVFVITGISSSRLWRRLLLWNVFE